jgi:hypothetical protein
LGELEVPRLKHVVLWRGLIDLSRDIPNSDVDLLALRNRLLARKELHPALQYLLLQAMREVHSAPRFGEFPAEQPNDLPSLRRQRRSTARATLLATIHVLLNTQSGTRPRWRAHAKLPATAVVIICTLRAVLPCTGLFLTFSPGSSCSAYVRPR